MIEIIAIALVFVIVAGFINGSFATPMKYMLRWEEENIWLIFSFWGFLILPWITIFIMVPDAFNIIEKIPSNLLYAMILGGIGFGLGQIAFATSFRYIGIGLAFVINISIGTSGSALIPILWHKGIMGTTYSYVQILGILIFILAVCFSTAAGSDRDKHKKLEEETSSDEKTKTIKPGMLILGIMLALLAGAGSVCQGVSYIWSNPGVSKIAMDGGQTTKLAASIISWVIIFSAAWVPYFLYFLILNLKNRTLSKLGTGKTGAYWIYTLLMGVGFWGSLIFFSRASNEIGGDLAPTIAWPLFMVFIILTSNFWSFKSGEWKNARTQAKKKMATSLVLFIFAILVFSYSSGLQPKSPATPDDRYHNVHFLYIQHDNYPTYEITKEVQIEIKEKATE
ncbi:MAG: L-rhamnose/proton symporter RhaT [Pseudomonadota bacterium]